MSIALSPALVPVPRVRLPWLLVGLGAALLPWLIGLAAAGLWNWAGLDALEAAGLVSTGLLLRRGDPRYRPAAAVTALLLVADAWFDTHSAVTGGELTTALTLAFLAELPLAAFCARLALRRA